MSKTIERFSDDARKDLVLIKGKRDGRKYLYKYPLRAQRVRLKKVLSETASPYPLGLKELFYDAKTGDLYSHYDYSRWDNGTLLAVHSWDYLPTPSKRTCVYHPAPHPDCSCGVWSYVTDSQDSLDFLRRWKIQRGAVVLHGSIRLHTGLFLVESHGNGMMRNYFVRAEACKVIAQVDTDKVHAKGLEVITRDRAIERCLFTYGA